MMFDLLRSYIVVLVCGLSEKILMDWGDYDTLLHSKTNFYKSQLPQFPQQFGGGLSRKPDYHKTPSPLPPPPLQ